MKETETLKEAFENFTQNMIDCKDEQCSTTEEINLKDYPSYTEALYAQLIAPTQSGVFISRWDIKEIALVAGDSMTIQPRKRMFEMLMKYATNRDTMQRVLDALEAHIETKIEIYEECIEKFPASREIFEPQITKAKRTIGLFPRILEEYFPEYSNN